MDETEKRQFEADLAKRGLELGEHVRLARTIQAPAADAWKVISKPGELNKNHPYTQRVLENPQQRFIMCCETARIVTTWSLMPSQ